MTQLTFADSFALDLKAGIEGGSTGEAGKPEGEAGKPEGEADKPEGDADCREGENSAGQLTTSLLMLALGTMLARIGY